MAIIPRHKFGFGFDQIKVLITLYEEQLTAYSASIPHEVEFLDEHHNGCACIRLILLFEVFCLSSLSMVHSKRTQWVLES